MYQGYTDTYHSKKAHIAKGTIDLDSSGHHYQCSCDKHQNEFLLDMKITDKKSQQKKVLTHTPSRILLAIYKNCNFL